MTPEEQQEKVIEFKALAYYSTPYGKPNPQTYAFIKGYEIACIEKDAQISELDSWKNSAKEILNSLDLQQIGKELNLPLGSDIATKVLPMIKKYKNEISELEKRLKELSNTANDLMK